MAKTMEKTVSVLAGVGALNWGLVELLDFNLVSATAGRLGALPVTITYIAVGVSGAILVYNTLMKKK